ncbi:MAG: SPOR domain-containing protein [Bacteroidia bacterium]
MDNQHQLEVEKFDFEKDKVNRELDLRRREIELQEKEHSGSKTKKILFNPILIATITAVLGLTVDIIIKNYEHNQTLAELRRKQQSDLLLKALDGEDETLIAMKLVLLDSLKLISLSHEQRQWVIDAYAAKAGVMPEAINVQNIGRDTVSFNDTASGSQSTVGTTTKPKTTDTKPNPKPNPKPEAPKPPVIKPEAVSGYCILIGTDLLRNEANFELKLAQSKYPDARQVVNGKYTLTLVGNFATREQAAAELENARKVLNRPNAYIIRNLKAANRQAAESKQ